MVASRLGQDPTKYFPVNAWADMRGQGLIMGPLVSCFPSRTPQEELSSLLTFPAQPRNVNRGGGWGLEAVIKRRVEKIVHGAIQVEVDLNQALTF